MTTRGSRHVWLAGAILALACGKGAPGAPNGSAPEPLAEAHEAPPGSDLDRPVEELFAATCEHGQKTFECGECRYGVGVVRVPRDLEADGLVSVVPATRRPIEAVLELTGVVRFDERQVTHLSPRSDGVIRAVHVAPGDSVRAGQALVEIESLAVGEAEGEYAEARALRELTRRALDRQSELRRAQISSEREYLQARQEFEAADIRTRTAAARLSRLGRRHSPGAPAASQAPGRVTLDAPADGTVLTMHAVPGETVKSDESVMVVGDVGRVWVFADVYEADLAQVAAHKGRLRASFTVRAFPDREFPGEIEQVGVVMDEASRTVKIRIGAANIDGLLRPGMFATVRLALPGGTEALAVPRSAVLRDEGRSFVFLRHHDEFFVRRPVRTGREGLDVVEVLSGLTGGEAVVAEGSFLLKSDVLRSKMGAGCAD